MAGGNADASARTGARLATAAGIVLALGAAAALASAIPAVAGGATPTLAIAWLPALGVGFAFRVDGLSLLFGALIGGIGALVLLYSDRYLRGHPHAARVQILLTLFMLSMLGLVLADDALLLFAFWELTTVTSYLLIGFDHENPRARRSALQAMLVTGAGGLAMLVGFLILASVTGTMRVSGWVAANPLSGHVAYTAVFALVALGAFTKSAQFPFHFWLPNAMAAPTPVSAYLHSATMVKAGVYVLMRLHPVLGGTDAWFWTLTSVGSVTAMWGSILALRQTDLKLALAYTTVTALGFLVLFLGGEATVAVTAAVTFLIVHALYKSALFLVVGIVDHATGTREVLRLGGLARAMPVTAAAAALAALSMAGFPPLLGFIGKELKYEAALAIVSRPSLLAAMLVVTNALTFAVAAVVAFRPFWRGESDTPRMPREAPRRMCAGPLSIAATGFAFGVYPEFVGRLLVEPAVAAIRTMPVQLDLALWHGINLPLVLSVATALLGLLFYATHEHIRKALGSRIFAWHLGGERAFEAMLDALRACAAWQTRMLQGGSLRGYLFVTWLAMPLVVGSVLIGRGGLARPTTLEPVPAYVWPIAALVAASSVAPIVTTSRLASIAALGLMGAGVSLLYLIFGAPDLAMTQLLVETLTVVIFAVVLLRLPQLGGRDDPGAGGRVRDGALAIAAGATMTALLLAVLASPLDRTLSTWFASNAVPEGFGRNIVNVIIVDFRSLDTLGEIAVVTVAACAAYALLRLGSWSRAGREGA